MENFALSCLILQDFTFSEWWLVWISYKKMTVLIIHLSSYLHSFPASLGISSWCLKLFKSSLWCPWTLPLQLQVFSEVFYCFLFYLLLTKFCIPIALFYPPQTVFFLPLIILNPPTSLCHLLLLQMSVILFMISESLGRL